MKTENGTIHHYIASNRYRARVMLDGVQHYLGTFKTRDAAAAAIENAIFDYSAGQFTPPALEREQRREAKLKTTAALCYARAALKVQKAEEKKAAQKIAAAQALEKMRARIAALALKPKTKSREVRAANLRADYEAMAREYGDAYGV